MKAGWELKTLGEVCRIELGSTPSRGNPKFWDKQRSTGNIWLSIRDLPLGTREVVSESREYVSDLAASTMKIVPKGTLIASFKLTLGRLAFAGCDLRTNEAIAAFYDIDTSILKVDYLYWYLNFFDWDAAAEGSEKVKGKTLNKSKLKDIVLLLPPLDEQKRIVSILDEAFEGLDRARENAEANLKSARELLNASLNSAFNPDQGAARTSWEVKPLGEICEIAPKKALVKNKLTDEQLVSFVPMNHLGELESHFTAQESRPLSSVYKGYTYFCDNDVIIAKITPCFENGKMGVASGMTNGVGFGSSEFVPIRGQGKTLPKYLFYYLLRDDFRENGARVMSGAVGHKRVPKEYMENLPIPLPALEEQRQIVDLLDSVSNKCKSIEAYCHSKLKDISDLRQSILQKAFAGELT